MIRVNIFWCLQLSTLSFCLNSSIDKDFDRRYILAGLVNHHLIISRRSISFYIIWIFYLFKIHFYNYISFSNDWIYHRQGTSLHEFMHALWFEHMNNKNNWDYFVYSSDDENYQYSIPHFSKELTLFDPFSVMFYDEVDEMKRDPLSRLWKLK